MSICEKTISTKASSPLVTVVTVVYNAESLIEETIQSVVGQSYEGIEYIVVDGMSTDNTLSIIKRYQGSITHCISEKDRGIYDAMNKAIDIASGKWINFMNAGDVFYSNNTISDIFAKDCLNDASLIYGSHYWKDFKGNKAHVAVNDLATMWQRIAFSHQSLFSRTSIMKKYKFNLAYDIVADYAFYFHLYMHGYKFINADMPVSIVLANGFSDKNFMRRTIERWFVVSKYKDEPKVHQFYLDLVRHGRKEWSSIKSVVENEQCKISVIVPNYNNEKYIGECLDSILSQTHKNIEILVIDDCSTDDSMSILSRYAKDYNSIRLFSNKKNQGVAKSRDIAINKATGDYITTLDSDDYLISKDKLKKELELILKYKHTHKQDVIIFSNIVLVHEDRTRIGYQANKKIEQGDIFGEIFGRECMIPRDFLFTKEMYKKAGGFDFDVPIYEDWDLKIRLSSTYHFYHADIDGVGYRRHGKGLSSVESRKHKKWLKNIALKNLHLIIGRKDKIKLSQKIDGFINLKGLK